MKLRSSPVTHSTFRSISFVRSHYRFNSISINNHRFKPTNNRTQTRNLIWRIFHIFLTALSIALAPSPLHADNDSTEVYDPFKDPGIMHIGYLDPDCVKDTLYATMDKGSLQWMPRYICWGKLYSDDGDLLCPSGKYDASLKKAERLDTTHIVMPTWGKLSCALSVERFNMNDTLDDLIFWIRGIDSIEGQGGEVTTRDTSRGLVLFGQSRLSTHKEILLKAIEEFDSGEYYAMELGYGKELINPKKRDLTRKTSWELKRVSKEMKKQEEQEEEKSEEKTEEREKFSRPSVVEHERTTRIWPNPAIYTTSVEIEPLAAGSYSVEVVALNGQQVWSQVVVLQSQGQVFKRIDLRGLPSGHYLLRVSTSDESIGVYPIIIVR